MDAPNQYINELKHSYKISTLWNTEINKLRLIHLMRKRIYGRWKLLSKIIIQVNTMVHMNKSDYYIYNELKKNIGIETVSYDECSMNYRSMSRVNDIKQYIDKPYDSYLDIGCYNGHVTNVITQYLHKYNSSLVSHGIDVEHMDTTGDFEYKIYDGSNIPYSDKMFDIVTMFMVLHHVSDVNELLKNIYRVMKPGGLLIVREHDVDSQVLGDVIDIQHDFYDIVWGTGAIDIHNYKTKEEWDSLFINTGFTLKTSTKETKSYVTTKNRRRIVTNPFQIYYSVYCR